MYNVYQFLQLRLLNRKRIEMKNLHAAWNASRKFYLFAIDCLELSIINVKNIYWYKPQTEMETNADIRHSLPWFLTLRLDIATYFWCKTLPKYIWGKHRQQEAILFCKTGKEAVKKTTKNSYSVGRGVFSFRTISIVVHRVFSDGGRTFYTRLCLSSKICYRNRIKMWDLQIYTAAEFPKESSICSCWAFILACNGHGDRNFW